MTGPALDGLSEATESEQQAHIDMPEGFDGVSVKYVDIHFLPLGHPGGPENTYWAVPHFDFHFFLQDDETTATYTDASIASNPLPAAYVPEGYILAPDSFVPGEGAHWVNPAEFGGPYTTNFIYGSYDAELTFVEPMERLGFLQDIRGGKVGDFTGAIGTAGHYQIDGLYPAEYSISYLAEEDTFYIELSNLVMGSAVPEPSTSGQLPGNCNQDDRLDIADAVCLINFLFRGTLAALPCGDGTRMDPANVVLIDWSANGEIELTDAIAFLNWNFLGGPEHALGTDCVLIPGCPELCVP